jgi:2-polyprenyl-6-methoxyphenol hydroxylase-like FAD-dependent oxidoreductase
LIARFGYFEGANPDRDKAPAIVADEEGWSWTARVRPGLYHWTRLRHDGEKPDPAFVPNGFHGLSPRGRSRGADVSWRIVEELAGPGYFLVGDAATVLDPTSSHGVLKALMSGMMAAHLITRVIRHGENEFLATQSYCDWIHRWFAQDVTQLRNLYARLPDRPDWLR